MTDENVNDIENEEKDECCGQGCCDGVGDDKSRGGGGFKGLLFLIVLILAGVVVANSLMNKDKAATCPTTDKAATCPITDKAATCDMANTAACPTVAVKAEKKSCCPSSKPADAAAACPSMAK